MSEASWWARILLILLLGVQGDFYRPASLLEWAHSCLNASGVLLDPVFLSEAQEEHAVIHNRTLEATKRLRSLNRHHYRGFRGPWIENYFVDRFVHHPASFFYPIIPLFIQWTDYSRLVHSMDSDPLLQGALDEAVDKRFPYLAVSQHDCGIHQFMKMYPNIIVLSAGGNGHVPIPLLMRELQMPSPSAQRPIEVSFQGTLKFAWRKQMVGSVIASGVKVDVRVRGGGDTYEQLLGQSIFSLAPMGCGRTSFRLYEILQSGSIPIYLYDNVPWLAYAPVLDWSKISLVYSNKNMSFASNEINRLLANPAELLKMQTAIRETVHRYFTYNATLKHIEVLFDDTPNSELQCTAPPPQWCCFGINIFDKWNRLPGWQPNANRKPKDRKKH